MGELFSAIVVVIVGGGFTLTFVSTLRRPDQRPVLAALLLHLAASAAQIIVTKYYYGYGDMLSYHRSGVELAGLMRSDFAGFGPEVFRLLFQQENDLVWVHGNGSSTGTMRALAGWLCFFLQDSLWAGCFVLSFAALSGQVAIYLALRACFAEAYCRRIAWSALFFPSVVFWGSGILKETMALAGLGWAFWGFVQVVLLRRRISQGIVALVLGSLVVGMTKAYILFAFAVAGSIAYYWQRGLVRRRPVRLLENPVRLAFAVGAMLAAVAVLGSLFPRYSVGNVAEEAADIREIAAARPGGSTIEVAEPTQRGMVGQVAFVPVGLASALTRPLLFEVRNPMMLLSALEMTALLFGLFRVWRRTRLRRSLDLIRSHPLLVFALVFVLVLGTGVGISTINLGTMARYRMPMLPFYGLIIAILLPLSTQAHAVGAPSRRR